MVFLSRLHVLFSSLLRFRPTLSERGRALRLTLSFALGAGLIPLLSGCGDSSPPESFPTPDYSYLPRLNLAVAHLDIIDSNNGQNGRDDLAQQDPTPPAEALRLMAEQRLNATGTGNSQGQFTIVQSSITREDSHVLTGNFTVQLRLDDATQNHHGAITASVSRTTTAADGESKAHHLYALTQTMMDTMNVELEYQIRKNLSDWLTDATGSPLNSTVQSQNLSGSPLTPTGNSSLSGNVPTTAPMSAAGTNSLEALPPAPSVPNNNASSEKIHSPPPGVLHLPGL